MTTSHEGKGVAAATEPHFAHASATSSFSPNPAVLEELQAAADVLGEICDYFPGRMTKAELEIALPERARRWVADDIDGAISYLVSHGLARRDSDGYLTPTMAAMSAYLLLAVMPTSPSLS